MGTWKGVETEKGGDRGGQKERKRAREASGEHMGIERESGKRKRRAG